MPKVSTKENRLKANEFGKYCEEKASEEYVRRGYAVMERNWHLGKTEIDLILQKDDVVVFSEVKARKLSEEEALSAVTHDKRKRMIRAADSYLRRLPGIMRYRFDIVACSGTIENVKLEIFEDAFLAADLY